MTSGIKRIFLTPLTANVSTDKENVGTLRFEGNSVYKWVEFSGTTAVVAGDVVCYVMSSIDTEVVVDGANSAVGAGVAMAAAATGAVSYGWIQTEGVATLALAFGGTTPTAGETVTTTGATAGTVTVTAAVTNQVVGVILDVTNKIMSCSFPH